MTRPFRLVAPVRRLTPAEVAKYKGSPSAIHGASERSANFGACGVGCCESWDAALEASAYAGQVAAKRRVSAEEA